MKELQRFRQFLAEGKLNEYRNLLNRASSRLTWSHTKLEGMLDDIVSQLESTIPSDKKEEFDQAVLIARKRIIKGTIQNPKQITAIFKEIFV